MKNIPEKALSVNPPYAQLIVTGIKDIENRYWATQFRGKVFIHVTKFYKSDPLPMDFIMKFPKEQKDKFFEFLKSNQSAKLNLSINSAIIGEVEIVDCVVNHPSVWAEKSDFKFCECFPKDCRCGEFKRQKQLGIKPIYNWVLANPVLYEKPIENVKGKLSFWYPDIDIVECIGCSGKFDSEFMEEDDANEKYCQPCWDELSPIFQAEYAELKANGEID